MKGIGKPRMGWNWAKRASPGIELNPKGGTPEVAGIVRIKRRKMQGTKELRGGR